MARVAADDDGIDRFVVCRYIPVTGEHGPPAVELSAGWSALERCVLGPGASWIWLVVRLSS